MDEAIKEADRIIRLAYECSGRANIRDCEGCLMILSRLEDFGEVDMNSFTFRISKAGKEYAAGGYHEGEVKRKLQEEYSRNLDDEVKRRQLEDFERVKKEAAFAKCMAKASLVVAIIAIVVAIADVIVTIAMGEV